MGTRSYGDDFSEEKRKAHIAKAEATTSATLGMRICGMQVSRWIGSSGLVDKYPLDLKMGTCSYGDGFSEEKRKAHIAKAESTTLATLGMRICGMQVGRWIGSSKSVDKYLLDLKMVTLFYGDDVPATQDFLILLCMS